MSSNLVNNQTPLLVGGYLTKNQMALFGQNGASGAVAAIKAEAVQHNQGYSATLANIVQDYQLDGQFGKASAIQSLDRLETMFHGQPSSPLNGGGPPNLISNVTSQDVSSGMKPAEIARFGSGPSDVIKFMNIVAQAVGLGPSASITNVADQLVKAAMVSGVSSGTATFDRSQAFALNDLNIFETEKAGYQTPKTTPQVD